MARNRRIRIVSGGQTGVDRAALDVAVRLGFTIGGWCPQGRLTEARRIPRRFRLRETPSAGYAQRTNWNVRDSDGTLIVNRGVIDGGTARTVRVARESHRKPIYFLRLELRADPARFGAWLARHRIRILNVAGPRESKRPGIHGQASKVLHRLLRQTLRIGGRLVSRGD